MVNLQKVDRKSKDTRLGLWSNLACGSQSQDKIKIPHNLQRVEEAHWLWEDHTMAWMERAGVTKRRLRARKKYEESSEENETIKKFLD